MNKENRKIIDQLNFAVGAVTEAGCYLNSGLVEAGFPWLVAPCLALGTLFWCCLGYRYSHGRGLGL